jgi:MtaA/CmuA family methyltransferase
MQFAAEHIGSNYGAFASDYRVLVRANEACARDFGMDQVSCISDPYRETQGFGGKMEYVRDGVPHCTHPLEQSKDLGLLRQPDPDRSERMRDRVDAARLFRDRLAGEYSILGWVEGPAAEAADLRSVTNFLTDLMDDEPFAGDLMDLCLEVAIAFAGAQIAAGCDTVGIGDAIASQVSPDLYERLIWPRQRKLAQAIHDRGAFVKLHICGNITHLLPAIASLGVDILDFDHMVDPGRVRQAVGRDVALTGNIDPVEGICRGTPAAIQNSIRRIYGRVGNPYMVNAGCEIPANTPPENLRALCEPLPFIP